MPCAHQVPAGILSGTHQIAGSFFGLGGHPHRGELTDAQQPGQALGVAAVGLDLVPGRALQLRGRHHLTSQPQRSQGAGQSEASRAGLVGDGHRPGQRGHPFHDLLGLARQPQGSDFAGLGVDRASHDRASMNIKSYTRTLQQHPAPPVNAAPPPTGSDPRQITSEAPGLHTV